MSDLKISELTRLTAAQLWRETLEAERDLQRNERTIQSAINEACRPLVEALEDIGQHCPSRRWPDQLAREVLAAHRKEHG